MGILDTFLYLQPGLFLSETLEVCPAQEAHYYIEADNCNAKQTQEMLQMSPKQTITNQRVQFFRVRHVANALIQTNRPFLFLKVLLAPSYTLEATVHRAIDQLCRPHTPNLIVTHYVRVVDEGLFTLQYMLLEYGNSLKLNLIGLGSLCDYTEFETTLFSCFFQAFHAIGILHAYHFQHRDVRPENWVTASAARSPVTHYLIEGVHYRIPLVCRGVTLVPMLLDFGLAEPIHHSDNAINNVETNLAPDFVFFTNQQKSINYCNSDEVFGTALTLFIMMKKFVFPVIDSGILRFVRSIYQNQRHVASPAISELINIRNLDFFTRQAFFLVLLLGFPSPEECPVFYGSQVGQYMSKHIGEYICALPCYNFLASQDGEAFEFLRHVLKWGRGDRPTAKEILLMPQFARFVTARDPRCAEKPHYIWPENEAMDTL